MTRALSAMRLIVGGAVAAALCLTGGVSPAVATPRPATHAVATTALAPHVIFGAHVNGTAGQQFRNDVTSLEQQIGRKLAVVHTYRRWDSTFPSPDDIWARHGGRAIAVDISPIKRNGTLVTWPEIAAAVPGDPVYQRMVDWANGIAGFGAHVYVSFDHEPELPRNAIRGTPADFVAAWRNLVDVFRSHGATDVTWIWNVTAYSFRDVNGHWYAAAYYPGDDYVDAIGAEDYNWEGCRPGIPQPYRPFGNPINGLRLFGLLHPDKPLTIMEYGAAYSSAFEGSQAQWLTQMHQTLEQPAWHQIAMVSYFDPNDRPTVCDWRLTGSSAVQAFADMANDPYFGATTPPVPGPPAITAHGEVDRASGQPVAGATVSLLSPWGSDRTITQASTDSNGQWTVSIAPGRYAIRITPPPGAPLAPVTLPRTHIWSGAHVTTTLNHAVVARISGTFVDHVTQQPLSGSILQLLNGSTVVASTTTDAQGGYSLWAPLGSYTLTMTGPATSTLQTPVQLSANTTIGGEFPDTSLTVVVERSDGSPVRRSNVTIPRHDVTVDLDGHTATGVTYPGTEITGSDGAATFGVLPGQFRVIATPPAGSGLKQRAVTVTAPVGQPVVIKLSNG